MPLSTKALEEYRSKLMQILEHINAKYKSVEQAVLQMDEVKRNRYVHNCEVFRGGLNELKNHYHPFSVANNISFHNYYEFSPTEFASTPDEREEFTNLFEELYCVIKDMHHNERVSNIVIEEILPVDAERVCAHLIHLLPEWFGIPEANDHYIKGCLERYNLVVLSEQFYIGLISIEFPSEYNANIFWMAIEREYHRYNIGSKLIAAAERYCIQQGYKSLTVETVSPKFKDPNYLKTYEFYKKNGFNVLFELAPYGSDLTMCYLQKSLIPCY